VVSSAIAMIEERRKHRLKAVQIDEASLAPMTRDVEHERQVAIFDLLEENYFQPVDAETGPYDLAISRSTSPGRNTPSGTCCPCRPSGG